MALQLSKTPLVIYETKRNKHDLTFRISGVVIRRRNPVKTVVSRALNPVRFVCHILCLVKVLPSTRPPLEGAGTWE